ncbi:unnamed protein product [Mytilus edulis]|uniref:Uncharacterized protein n=1 Tax=Mytilus edulis TaxID=6550 RepID=A0A8S3TF48_MYTED|nr:unnamed protein product [Mytilus edulis]
MHNTLSAIAFEQINKVVKGEGGVIGLTENASPLLRWMVCGPEKARAVNEYELPQELIKHEQNKVQMLDTMNRLKFGQLRLSSKSDLLVPLEKICVIVTESPDLDAIILDGAVIVNILKPRFCKTLKDYSKQVLLPHINNYLKSCSQKDVIWDETVRTA